MSRPPTIYQLFKKDPQLALEESISRHVARAPYQGRGIFCWQSRMGTDGARYGSYRFVSEKEIQERKPKLTIVDYAVGLLWLDETYDHINHRSFRHERPTNV